MIMARVVVAGMIVLTIRPMHVAGVVMLRMIVPCVLVIMLRIVVFAIRPMHVAGMVMLRMIMP